MALTIFANLDRTLLSDGIVQSATNLIARPAPELVAGDSLTVDIFLTSQSGFQNITTYSQKLGVGDLGQRPTGGTWNYGSAANLAYNVDADGLEAVITGDCEVTELSPFVFKVLFENDGAQTISAIDSTNLTPSSSVVISRLVDGDATTREQWLIRLFRNPLALTTSWTNIVDGNGNNGIRGVLNLGTAGIYDLIGSSNSVATTLELELTDGSGSVETVFQSAVTVRSDAIGQGTGDPVPSYDNYVTNQQLTTGTYNLDVNGIKGRERIEIAYPVAEEIEWWLQADIEEKFSIFEYFSSAAFRTFSVDRFSNVEINTLTLAENNRYDTRNNPSRTTVREFQKTLISDDGVVPTSSAVQKYIAETSPITVIAGTGGQTYSKYKNGEWTQGDINAVDTSFGTGTLIEAVQFGSEVGSIGSGVFKDRVVLKFVDFGQIPTVVFEACRECTDLERVIMRTSNKIGQHAFDGCISLRDVDLGSVTDIGFKAFYGCTGLESITIPASVTVLGNNVFDGCQLLEEVNCYADKSVFHPANGKVFQDTNTTLVIHAKIESDWVEGTGLDFQGNPNVTVIKDLV